ncbi:MAG TPA: hypothetical protein VNW06_01230 [Cytophagaceae bacterium]|jgi:hypothetical protein|nr:hypothetical protein [Cytophagaceae bacterium]
MANNQDKINDDLLFALINKGGSTPSGIDPKDMSAEDIAYYTQIITYQLRMPRWLAKQIDDECRKFAPVFHSRHGWIMDAIISKLANGNDEKINIIKYEPIISKKEIVQVATGNKMKSVEKSVGDNLSPTEEKKPEPLSLLDMLESYNIKKKPTAFDGVD